LSDFPQHKAWAAYKPTFTKCKMVTLYSAASLLSTLFLVNPHLPLVDGANPCISNRTELKDGINKYISQGCDITKDCDIGKNYGWPMNSWCVSNVTDMSSLFEGNPLIRNENIADWDTSSVTNMSRMFKGVVSFTGDLSRWNTSSVLSMDSMFEDATAFNSDLSKWDTAKVTNMEWMFSEARAFNSDLSQWDTSKVESMWRMFTRTDAFNTDLSSWDILNVTTMANMFEYATAFNQNLCAWGDIFPYDSDSANKNIFLNSGCTSGDTPQRDQRGPFCASNCSESNSTSDGDQIPSGAASVSVRATAAGASVVASAIIFGQII